MTVFRSNDEPDPMPAAAEQIRTGVREGPQPPTAQPFPDSEARLAASINELREKDAEYARLNTEQAREQWENITRANVIRKREQEAIRESEKDLGQGQQQAELIQREQHLVNRAKDILASIPSELMNDPRFLELPLEDQLRRMPQKLAGDYIETLQEFDALYQSTGRPAFDEMMQTAQPQQQPQPALQQPAPQLNQGPTQQNSIAEYWADEQAKTLGFSNRQEMIQWGQDMSQFREEYRDTQIASDFLARCPEFPNSGEASEKLTAIISANGWETTADNLQAAHAIAMQRHLYEPLTPEQQQASIGNAPLPTRHAPPPMIRSSAPDNHGQQQNEWSRPLADLRASIIRQQLEEKSPRY